VEVFIKKMKLMESIYVAILSAIGNFFGPLLGGTTIRALYLKKNHNLPYSYFTSTLAGYYLILFSVNNLLAIISLLLLDSSSYRNSLLLFFSVWLVVLVGLMFARLPDRKKVTKIDRGRIAKYFWNALYEVESGWHQLLRSPRSLPKMTSLALGGFFVTYATTFVEFKALDINISLAALGLYTVISISSMLISLTPGAIGIRESLLLLTSSAMGVSNAEILQVSIIDRGASFLVLFILYVALKLMKQTKGLTKKNAESAES
jgi:uncharacterized protein (TIRG00374 family)